MVYSSEVTKETNINVFRAASLTVVSLRPSIVISMSKTRRNLEGKVGHEAEN